MIPEWMLLLEMTEPERVAYLARKQELEKAEHMRRVRSEQKRAFWTEFEKKRQHIRKG